MTKSDQKKLIELVACHDDLEGWEKEFVGTFRRWVQCGLNLGLVELSDRQAEKLDELHERHCE